jgi:uncharacterized protein
MRYALGPLRHSGGCRTVELHDPLPPGTGVVSGGTVEGRLALTNAGSSVSARGRLCVAVRLECGRCLAENDHVLEIPVNEECALAQVDAPEAQLASAGQDGQIPILNDEDLDLSELVRQLVALCLPSRPLCREDCAGLCPRCGHNLNEGPCRCGRDDADPRWAALKTQKL